jgi:hypothetical protein
MAFEPRCQLEELPRDRVPACASGPASKPTRTVALAPDRATGTCPRWQSTPKRDAFVGRKVRPRPSTSGELE